MSARGLATEPVEDLSALSGRDLAAYFDRVAPSYFAALAAYLEASQSAQSALDALPVSDSPTGAVAELKEDQVAESHKAFVRELVNRADAELGRNGLRVGIALEDVIGLPAAPGEYVKFWDLLVAAYPPERAAQLINNAYATRFVRAFGLKKSEKPAVKAGRVTLSLSMYGDSWSGDWRYDYESRRLAYTVMEALHACAANNDWGMPSFALSAVERALERFESRATVVEPQSGVRVVTYKNKVDFSIPVAKLGDLQVFVAAADEGAWK